MKLTDEQTRNVAQQAFRGARKFDAGGLHESIVNERLAKAAARRALVRAGVEQAIAWLDQNAVSGAQHLREALEKDEL